MICWTVNCVNQSRRDKTAPSFGAVWHLRGILHPKSSAIHVYFYGRAFLNEVVIRLLLLRRRRYLTVFVSCISALVLRGFFFFLSLSDAHWEAAGVEKHRNPCLSPSSYRLFYTSLAAEQIPHPSPFFFYYFLKRLKTSQELKQLPGGEASMRQNGLDCPASPRG